MLNQIYMSAYGVNSQQFSLKTDDLLSKMVMQHFEKHHLHTKL